MEKIGDLDRLNEYKSKLKDALVSGKFKELQQENPDYYKNICRKSLKKDAYWSVNKQVARSFSLESSVLLSEFLYLDENYENNIKDTSKAYDGWFYRTRDKIQEDTTLTPHEQRIAIGELSEVGILASKEQGIPQQTFYKLNYERIAFVLSF